MSDEEDVMMEETNQVSSSPLAQQSKKIARFHSSPTVASMKMRWKTMKALGVQVHVTNKLSTYT